MRPSESCLKTEECAVDEGDRTGGIRLSGAGVASAESVKSPGGGRAAAGSAGAAARREELPTVEERTARGKSARKDAPRSSHGRWSPAADRPDPVDLLEEQAAGRVSELVPIRYGRMLVSPFTFYRGAAVIMAADLAATPRSGLVTQVCGDAHLSNFGVFASPERQLVFDINDFDETLPGPWEWDVKRLAASLEIAGRDRGFAADQRREIVRAGVTGYRTWMRQAATMRNLDVWYSHIEVDQLLEAAKESGVNRKERAKIKANVAKARTRDSVHAFAKLTRERDGHPRIIADPPLIVPVEDLLPAGFERDQAEQEMLVLLSSYQQTLEAPRRHLFGEFAYVHMARKVVGVGSVGTRTWIVLLLGRDGEDPLLLQAKEADVSVLERYVGRSRYGNHGRRVVEGQRLMQATSDIFLGWQRVAGMDGATHDYYLRQLRDWKGSADVDVMPATAMRVYAEICGAALARAHARTGDRIALAAYLGTGEVFDTALTDFASAYADQNERDYQALVDAVRSGRVVAETGM
jgi:uncharacterized protein (DUF2252 family)